MKKRTGINFSQCQFLKLFLFLNASEANFKKYKRTFSEKEILLLSQSSGRVSIITDSHVPCIIYEHIFTYTFYILSCTLPFLIKLNLSWQSLSVDRTLLHSIRTIFTWFYYYALSLIQYWWEKKKKQSFWQNKCCHLAELKLGHPISACAQYIPLPRPILDLSMLFFKVLTFHEIWKSESQWVRVYGSSMAENWTWESENQKVKVNDKIIFRPLY